MPDQLPTLDDILGPEKPQDKLPTLDEILGTPKSVGYGMGPGFDAYMETTPTGKILNLFGQSAKDAYGTAVQAGAGAIKGGAQAFEQPGSLGFSEKSEEMLKNAGIFRRMDDDKYNVLKAFYEGWMRPAAVALDATARIPQTVIGAVVGGVSAVNPKAGEATADAIQVATDPGLVPSLEGMGPPGAIASAALTALRTPLLAGLSVARRMRVIGPEGEAGWKGTVDPTPPDPKIMADAADRQFEEAKKLEPEPQPGQPESIEPAPAEPPTADIHTVAREIAPDTFRDYDALTQRQQTFGRWLQELRATQVESAVASAPHAEEIADLNERMADATPRMQKKYAPRLEALNAERADYIEEHSKIETPDMQRVRQAWLENEYKLRDLSPDVTAAYQKAQETMPKSPEAPVEAPAQAAPEATPAAQEAPAPIQEAQAAEPEPAAPQAPVEPAKAPVNIAQDVSQKLVSAGRPQEEADAAGAIIAAHYDARAQRLGTAAQELYEKEAPNIVASEKGRKGETGRTIFKDGRTTIRLMQTADSSTFIHETGHVWLNELLKDGADERALPQTKADVQTVRDWLGAKGEADLTTRQHEKFATGFEQYMREGRAPSPELASVFAKFKQWLTGIYQTVKGLGRPINDDIRQVFDRMLAAPEKPTVIAPEREAPETVVARHEGLVGTTQPEHADTAADQIRIEADHDLFNKAPERQYELRTATGEVPTSEGAGAAPHGDEPAGQPEAPRAGGTQERGAIGEGGGEAPADRDQARGVYERVPREPLGLVDFIKREGGLKDDTFSKRENTARGREDAKRNPSDLRSMDAHKIPGLVRAKAGHEIDEMELRAFEAGYFKERPTRAEFLDALRDELSGNKRYAEDDLDAAQAHREAVERNTEIDRLTTEHGIETKGKTRAQVFDELAEKMSQERQAQEIASQTAAHEAALKEAEERAVEAQGDAFEPSESGGTIPRSLEDLEHERSAEEAATGPRPGGGVAVAPRPPGEGAGEAGAGPRGGGAGPAGSPTEIPAGANTVLPERESQFVDKAGNIRLDNLGTQENVNQALRDMAEKNDEFIEARRGVWHDSDVIALADTLGVSGNQINLQRLRQMSVEDEYPMAVRILAGRKMLVQAGTDLIDKMAAAADGDDAAVMAYAESADRLRMIQQTVSGITAEWGRAGRAFRALSGEVKRAEDLAGYVQDNTGLTLFQLRKQAQEGMKMDTAAKANKYARDVAKKGVFDWIESVAINAWLSGPFTHLKYTIAGQVLAFKGALLDTPYAAAVSAVRNAFGIGSKEYISIMEVPEQIYGFFRGNVEGIKAAGVAAVRNAPVLPPEVAAFQEREIAAGRPSPQIAGQSVNPKSVIPNPTIGGKTIPIGTILESPGRMVAALHTFNWTTFYTEALAQQAFRATQAEGFEIGTDAFDSRLAQLNSSPTAPLIKAAIEQANGGALLQRPGYDTIMGRLSSLTNRGFKVPDIPLPGGKSIPMGTFRPAKYIDPFVQIKGNLLKTAFGAYGFKGASQGGIMFDAAVGKALATSTIFIAGGALAARQLLTPAGPSDPDQAREYARIYGQPHGLAVGNMSYNMLRFGVLGLQLSVAANLYHVWHQASEGQITKAAGDLVTTFAKTMADESFLKGPTDLMRAVDDHDRYGERWVRDFITGLTPFSVGLSQVAREIDPIMREIHSWRDAELSKIPGSSQALLPKYDVWGQPVPTTGWLSNRPIQGDIVDRTLLNNGYYPKYPEDRIVGVKLTDQEFNDYVRQSGQWAHTLLERRVSQPGFSNLSAFAQHKQIVDVVDLARTQAQTWMKMHYPEIWKRAMQQKSDQLTAPTPGPVVYP